MFGVSLGMTKAHLVRLVALFGAVACAAGYVGFVLAGLNGGGARVPDLWRTVVFARPHVVLAWAIFVSCGAAAYVYRGKFGNRPIMLAVALVGLPGLWATGLRFLYYNQPSGWWPSFEDETWRWIVNHIYAEFCVSLMVGFLGAATATIGLDARARIDDR